MSFARVVVVLGDTSHVPNQGATIASETIQITAVPLRNAAAQARQFLSRARRNGSSFRRRTSSIEDGLSPRQGQPQCQLWRIDSGETIRLELAGRCSWSRPVERLQHRRAIGAARTTRPGEGDRRTGLCARCACARHASWPRRAPALRRRRRRCLRRHQPDRDRRNLGARYSWLVAVVRNGDFVGVVAEREENAIKAAAQFEVPGSRRRHCRIWGCRDGATRQSVDAANALDKGDVDAAIAAAAKPMQRTYTWPYQMHGSIGPSCAVADYRDGSYQGLVRHAEPRHILPRRSRVAGRTTGSRHRRDPDGSRRLLRSQLRRRCPPEHREATTASRRCCGGTIRLEGLIQPTQFIPLAEETGFVIIPIGKWVIEQACRMAVELQRRFPLPEPLRMSVNLSVKQMQSDAIVDDLEQILAETGLAPESLVLEVTETVMLADADVAADRLHRLKELGVRIAMDDFGTGYSSLSYLSRLPVDIIKMDRSFLGGGIDDNGLAAAIMAIGERLGSRGRRRRHRARGSNRFAAESRLRARTGLPVRSSDAARSAGGLPDCARRVDRTTVRLRCSITSRGSTALEALPASVC